MKIEEILKKYNQDHIINILNKLDGEKKEELIKQLKKIDFDKMARLYNKTKESLKLNAKIEPLNFIDKSKISKRNGSIINSNIIYCYGLHI